VSRFSSPAAALAYFVLAGMGVVALLVAAGQIEEAFVRRFVLPPVLLALVAAGLWEYRRRRGTTATNADADQ
jgi:hypothetical protein